jgi:CRISPR-associated protein Cas2
MMHRYYVTYDICDPRRLRKVYQVLKGIGEHVQLSVFCCDITKRQFEGLRLTLSDIIVAREDQVLFVELGPTRGIGPARVTAVGRPHEPRRPGPTIV